MYSIVENRIASSINLLLPSCLSEKFDFEARICWLWVVLSLIHFPKQLISDFVSKEIIPLDNVRSAEILLGRDTRPSGEYLLEAAKQVILFTLWAFGCYTDANSVVI